MPSLLIAPFLVSAIGAVIGLLWLATRRHNPFLALTAIGFFLVACGLAVHLSYTPLDARASVVVSAALYSFGGMLFSLATIRRAKLSGGISTLFLISAAIIAGTAWYTYFEKNPIAQIYVLNFGLGLILLCAAWRTRKLARGTNADRILFWWFLLIGLHYFPRTLLTAAYIPNAAGSLPDKSFFWVFSLFPLGGLVLFFGLVIIIVTGLDIIASIQDERDTDSLTGIRNRRGLERLLKNTATMKQPVSVIVCDIDNFKQVNDKHGHHGGDAVLQHFVRMLVAAVRESDIVARLGGEEFVVMMPRTPLREGVEIAERIRSSNLEMNADSIAPGLAVRCSMGVAEIKTDEDPWSALRRADDLLYRAKQLGRNRVVSEDSDNLLEFPTGSTLKKA